MCVHPWVLFFIETKRNNTNQNHPILLPLSRKLRIRPKRWASTNAFCFNTQFYTCQHLLISVADKVCIKCKVSSSTWRYQSNFILSVTKLCVSILLQRRLRTWQVPKWWTGKLLIGDQIFSTTGLMPYSASSSRLSPSLSINREESKTRRKKCKPWPATEVPLHGRCLHLGHHIALHLCIVKIKQHDFT